MIDKRNIPDELAQHIGAVTNKRARFVLDAIAERGVVTTEEISAAGYEHPPRAVRDARELGFPIQTIKVKHSNGRSIAAYIFPEGARFARGKSGRRVLSKRQRDTIIEGTRAQCQMCGGQENLQVDHRVPYEIGGESDQLNTVAYMVLCGSCNRKKSWACEHCPNWIENRDPKVCKTCYWSGSAQYENVATAAQRRADLIWLQHEIGDYEKLRRAASQSRQPITDYIKEMLRKI